MAITPQHEKGEPTEVDLEKAYNKARSIGLFLVEKYARQILREKANEFAEFLIDADGVWAFLDHNEREHRWAKIQPLYDLMDRWDDRFQFTGQGMRFTATGPVRREW